MFLSWKREFLIKWNHIVCDKDRFRFCIDIFSSMYYWFHDFTYFGNKFHFIRITRSSELATTLVFLLSNLKRILFTSTFYNDSKQRESIFRKGFKILKICGFKNCLDIWTSMPKRLLTNFIYNSRYYILRLI